MSDLKNDWVYGDTVMASDMNDIANAVNSKLDASALDGVALESSVQAINTKIGVTDDTGGSVTTGTVMAKLNAIQSGTETSGQQLSVSYGEYRQTTSGTYTAQLLSLNGSGKLYRVEHQYLPIDRAGSQYPVTYKLTIDNQLIGQFKVSNNTNYRMRDIYQVIVPGNDEYLYSNIVNSAYHVYSSSLMSTSSVSQGSTTEANMPYDLYICYLTNPLLFTSNITITCEIPSYPYSGGYPARLYSRITYLLS